ncbi:MAG: Asp-tRNA(Asn)/Glu-tRNA(Gln) amidotransferase subunit GatA [Clostridia bacterium]|nr:Asp-tRNA(Asn)/Glu-tRNA(Gln) amidotransferase subunit GatA [Clostridia bacterium]MCL6522330.1 Asp-tRNA(Asn)/Glu-tRNA(Gln) amidotransferase subunit GatA [Bacillota bacterium]
MAWRPVHELAASGASRREIAELFVERAARLDGRVHAFLTQTPERALEAAERADRAGGGRPSPWAGLPVALKDNLVTRGLRTTCASRMLADWVPPYTATAVERLEAAGLGCLGKTNLDEFAMGSSTEHSAFGPTRNPVDLERVPGGSSGGSAAAVAAAMAPWALGSDTGGSIRQPAAYCGVVGLKPSYGRVSRYGLVAFASSLDQIGPITRDVRDAAILLGLIAGHDPRDATSAERPVPDYLERLEEGVRGLRVGLPREYFGEGVAPEVREAVLGAARALEREGARVEETELPSTRYALAAYYVVAPAEASANLARYDGVRYGFRAAGATSYADLYDRTRQKGFGAEVRRRIMLGTYALSAGYYDQYYLKAQQVRTLIRREFGEAFRRFDLLLTPTAPTAAFRLGEVSDPLTMYMNDICTIPANLAGLPAISLPCGSAGGLPVGAQLMAAPFEEALLLRAARALEAALSLQPWRPAAELEEVAP